MIEQECQGSLIQGKIQIAIGTYFHVQHGTKTILIIEQIRIEIGDIP